MTVNEGFWSCCQARAEFVLAFDGDNGETVYYYACASCASSYPQDRVTPAADICQTCGYAKRGGKHCKRVVSRAVNVNDIVVGETLVVQDSIIRKAREHYGVIESIRELKYTRVITMRLGSGEVETNRYSRRGKVNLGITW